MIEFDHVSMAYQLSEELALKNVSFKVERGEFVFIIGSSGSGKSTIIKLLTCEERPLKGEIIVNGFSLNTIKKKQIPYLRRNIGMVFQDFRLIPSKTVFENVSYAMEIVGASRKAILHQVPMVLSIVGLRNRQSAYPYELSGGEQQRVAIARAMVNRPMMILADEPTGNLDPVNSESIMALLAEINKSGTTVLVCSHDKDLVNRMKKRVIMIDDGMKIRDDSEGTFYAEPNYLQATSEQVEPSSKEADESQQAASNNSEETMSTASSQAETTEVADTTTDTAASTANKELGAETALPASTKLNVSRVSEQAEPTLERKTFNTQARTNMQAKSWTEAVRHSLYHEQEADDKLFSNAQTEIELDGTNTSGQKQQRSNLSSERIERWGRRRF
ncbi:cell division ATP-binding protein FtsE [Amygdalobacter nucleatus]|uniref:cell division ATP-binding protein FtsE n=1 Tax=Amygdalobacter nucleatus TaxID=3029274 RepID=UPI0028E7C057|nr:cell division ATP-binding protein FtsE [Amygdalobacter nucleatus]